ncbi:MAG: hypothetical protein V1726_08045 [Methanobacteriota archaeon]
MKGSKILATLIVLAMVLSSLVVFKQLDVNSMQAAATTPGIDEWGIRKTDLKYNNDDEISVRINTSTLDVGTVYYVMYPYYRKIDSTFNITWVKKTAGGSPVTLTVTDNSVTASKLISSAIKLNVTGFWYLANRTMVDAGTIVNANNLAALGGYFWVNSSEDFNIAINEGASEVRYGLNETITITVTQGGSSVACWIDVYRNYDGAKVFHTYKTNGVFTFISDWKENLTFAGNYSVHAYKDKDMPEHGYDSGDGYFSATYGETGITADYYDYTVCGPWDPPEQNASKVTIRVLSGIPTVSIPVGNQTMFWGFDGTVHVNVKDYNDENFSDDGLVAWVYNQSGDVVNDYLTIDYSYMASDGWLEISNADAAGATTGGWGRDGTGYAYGDNSSSWEVLLFIDVDGDNATEGREWADEWNTSIEFSVDSAPGAQWKWIDDDGALFTGDNNDGVIPEVPVNNSQPLAIQFQIISDTHTYYGDDATADAVAPQYYGENITVSGNALFLPTTLDDFDEMFPAAVSYASGTWTVKLIPTMAMNGGEIVFAVDWEDQGSLTETLTIGGSKINGSIVTISPAQFTIHGNVTITVTAQDGMGHSYPNAEVSLWYVWENGTISTHHPIMKKSGGGNTAGEYTFHVNTTQQTTNQTAIYGDILAPRYIAAFVKLYMGSGYGTGSDAGYVYGYALTKMKPKPDMKITTSPGSVMAGQKTKFWFNASIIDSTGNKTGYPKTSDLRIRIYNSTGENVTNDIGSLSSDTALDGSPINKSKEIYFQKPGTYTVYLYNDTHNSEGHNATLVVQPVDVVCDMSEFIWNVDDNLTATFTITYNGLPVNGTLRIDNMTDNGTKDNQTWWLCNFTPVIGGSGFTHGYLTSIEVEVKNGAVTVSNINATHLDRNESRQDITFYFKPKGAGNAWAHTTGVVPVKIADVAASPKAIPFKQSSDLAITVTGRGVGLENVFVSIKIPGISEERNTTTNAAGKATFYITPVTTGDILIKVENRTSDTKVAITSWSLYVDVDAQVNEGASFTVTVRNGTATGAGIANADVMFNKETKKTGTDGKATFNAPAVTADRNMNVVATAAGYAEDEETITVLNVPKLMIIVSGSQDDQGTYLSPVTVTVTDDMGDLKSGVAVTFGAMTGTTINGQVEFQVTEEAAYTITAALTGFTAADPLTINAKAAGVPGFELLAFVAALGVAFILLRRRRK